ncbi:MAG TPA: histidine phosphatase family protein [Propionicimonas sp.]|nr:histidine phosphatase family protein [Propionicimonas sp.]HRA05312.1 histidine phosphatase family protein [Propionicimonas sp.]
MTTVVLLRHGVTDWNDGGRFQGHADVSLNDAGREQAAAAASMLAESGITRVYCSDLIRAAETAQIVAANLGLEVRTDARLREVDVGSWAGLSMAEAGELEPDFWPALREGRDFRRSATGETATESGLRVAAALADYVEAADADEVVLVVGHGLSLRVAAMLLIGLDYSHARRFGGMVNCHWAVLQPGDEHWRLLSYNVG